MKDTYGCPDKLKGTGYLLMLYNHHKTVGIIRKKRRHISVREDDKSFTILFIPKLLRTWGRGRGKTLRSLEDSFIITLHVG